MIRAHMATFPVRKPYMLKNIQNVLPQVDRLFLVLNQYDEIPEEIASEPKITAVIPDQDLMDVGKFYFQPEPGDFVLTMDDDLVYPAEYVEYMMSFQKVMDFDRMVISLHGLSATPNGWNIYHFRARLARIIGVNRLGTGVCAMRGKNVPPLSYMIGSEGYCDVRFAQWQLEHGNLMWTVPRSRGWVKGNVPIDLIKYSLFARYGNEYRPAHRAESVKLMHTIPENNNMGYYPWKRLQNKKLESQ